MKKNQLITTIGFILMLTGFMSIILSIVGLRFKFLSFIEYFGSSIGFIIKILFIVIGIVMIYISKSPEFREA